MQIIDSHVHFWNPNQFTYPWLDELPALNRPFLPANYAQAAAGGEVAGVVFVQADCLPEQGLAEVDWVTGLNGPVKAIVAFAPLEQGEAVRPVLEQLKQRPLVKSVRRLIQSEAVDFAAQPEFIRGVQLLAEYDLRFDICIKAPQLPAVQTLVHACPDVQFVLDHIGKPDIAHGEFEVWREEIRWLARFPNVACKLSGVITEADWQMWDVETIRPYLAHVLDCFGVERVMFGSDWPVINLAGSFARWVDALREVTATLSEGERQSLFYENCRQFYRISNE